jgi:hypothetical protein
LQRDDPLSVAVYGYHTIGASKEREIESILFTYGIRSVGGAIFTAENAKCAEKYRQISAWTRRIRRKVI